MKVPFKKSKYADKELHECPTEYLDWMSGELDVNHVRFGKQNQILVDECRRILNQRADGGTKPKNQATGLKVAQTGPPKSVLKELSQYIQTMYDCAVQAQSVIDVYSEENGKITHSSEHSPF